MRICRELVLPLTAGCLLFLAPGCGSSSGSSSNNQPAVQAPTALAYSAPTAVYTKGLAVAANTPTSSGGAVASYAVSPALPGGLALNTASGVLSGTPTAVTALGTYVITAANAGGSTQATLTITVNDAPPAGLTYTTGTVAAIRGVAITADSPTSTGGAVTQYTIAPPLPAGLSLAPATGVLAGTPTAVAASATYTVTASNSGGSTTASLTIAVTELAPVNLTYSTPTASYVRGLAIAANTPSSGGGAPSAYAVNPALPAGLVLNPLTGVITGTPTALAASSNFTVTATNTGGSATATLAIAVKDIAPAGLTYATNPASYTVGSAITPNLPASTGGFITSYAVSPALPAGLAFSPTTGAISGTPGAAAASTNYTVTASNSIGSTSVLVNLTVYPSMATLDLSVASVELTQSTQTPTNTVSIVAGKNGLIRVFVVANQANLVAPAVRISLLNNNALVAGYPKTVAAPRSNVPLAMYEDTLTNSWNLVVPGTDLAAPTGTGYSILAEVDPANTLGEANRGNNSFTTALTGTAVPTFKTTIFPVALASGTGNIWSGNKDAWVARLAKMYPVAAVDVVVGATFTSSVVLASDGTGWTTLLADLATKHVADAATDRYYYGAVNVAYASGTSGMGYVPGSPSSSYQYRTAIGWDKASGYADGGLYPEVFAHEVGHNMGRQHSPCGSPSNPDTAYPYPGGLIGVWGYDTVNNVLQSPLTVKDIMGYCSPVWVSDYVYQKILAFRTPPVGFLAGGATAADVTAAQDCLVVRGIVHDDGTVELLPSFRTRALPTAAPASADHTLEFLDAGGNLVATTPLALVDLGCLPREGEQHFVVALPFDAATLDRIAGLTVRRSGLVLATSRSAFAGATAPAPDLLRLAGDKVQVTWDAAVHPGLMVRDPQSGEVLAILTGGQQAITTQTKTFDLVFSDGVTGHTVRKVLAD
jgi:uncharacterized repeat protein (TIGR01451 family)